MNANDQNGAYKPPAEPIVKEAAAFWANEMRNHPFPFYALQGKIGRRVLKNLHATRLRTNFEFTCGGKEETDTFGLFVFVTARGSRLAVNAPSINLLVRGPLTNKHRREVYATGWHRLVNFVRQFFGLDPLERKNNPLLRNLGLDENFVIPLGYESSSVIGGRKGEAKTTALYGKQHFENIGRLGGLKGGAKTTALYGKQHFENIGRLGGLKGGAKTTALYGKQHFENIGRLGGLKRGLAKTAAAIKKAAGIADKLKLPKDCHGFLLLTRPQQKKEVSKTYRAKWKQRRISTMRSTNSSPTMR